MKIWMVNFGSGEDIVGSLAMCPQTFVWVTFSKLYL